MRVEQAAGDVGVARTATDREFSRKVRFGASGEGGPFFVMNVNPLDRFQPSERIREPVQRIFDDAIDALHTGLGERLGQILCCSPAHPRTPRCTMLRNMFGRALAPTPPRS